MGSRTVPNGPVHPYPVLDLYTDGPAMGSDYSGFSGEVVNRCCFYPLPVLIAVVTLVSGCGTTKLPDLVAPKENRPWVFLVGAKVQEAKSLAMGAAVTKGWKIADASGDKLLVRRPLSITTAQAITGEPVATAAIEVKTDFDKRRTGVNVIVATTIVADKLTEKREKSTVRVDVTENYKEALNRSLSALRQSWEQNRWRIATAMRPSPTKDVTSKDKDTEDIFGAMRGREADTAASSPPGKTAAAPPVAASSTDDKAVTAAAPSTRSRPAPIEDRALSTPHSITPRTPDRATAAAAPSTHSRLTPAADRTLSTLRSALDMAMAAVAPGTRSRPASVEDQAISMLYSTTPSATGWVMPIPAPVETLDPRGRAAPIEDRALSTPRSLTPSTTDRAVTVTAPSTRSRVAPVEDRVLSAPRPITSITTPSTVSAAGPTPALDHARKAGAWAHYADQYARTYGCERSNGGTTLEYKHPRFEVHQIHCKNRRSFLLRCNAGACIKLMEN